MEHNEKKQYSLFMGVSGRKEKGIESIFTAVRAENFPNQGTRNRYPGA